MRAFFTVLVALAVLGLFTDEADAQAVPRPQWHTIQGYPGYEGYGIRYADGVRVQQWRKVAAAQPAQATGDAYGFTAWLNATRASYGLGAVGYDQNLANTAARNNVQQQARGMGHWDLQGARRQNSGMGAYATVCALWLQSPLHRAALLDPSIRSIGIAGLGSWWTFCGS